MMTEFQKYESDQYSVCVLCTRFALLWLLEWITQAVELQVVSTEVYSEKINT